MKTFYNLKTFTFSCSRMSTLLSQHQNRKVLFVIVQTSRRVKALSMCTCACVCASIGCRLICAFYIGCVKTSMKILKLGEYEWKINQFQSKNAKVDIEKFDDQTLSNDLNIKPLKLNFPFCFHMIERISYCVDIFLKIDIVYILTRTFTISATRVLYC